MGTDNEDTWTISDKIAFAALSEKRQRNRKFIQRAEAIDRLKAMIETLENGDEMHYDFTVESIRLPNFKYGREESIVIGVKYNLEIRE